MQPTHHPHRIEMIGLTGMSTYCKTWLTKHDVSGLTRCTSQSHVPAGQSSRAGTMNRISETGRRNRKKETFQPQRRGRQRQFESRQTSGKQTAVCAASSHQSGPSVMPRPAAQSPNDVHTDRPVARAASHNYSRPALLLSLPPSPPDQTPHPDRSQSSPSAPSRRPASPD